MTDSGVFHQQEIRSAFDNSLAHGVAVDKCDNLRTVGDGGAIEGGGSDEYVGRHLLSVDELWLRPQQRGGEKCSKKRKK